MNTKAKIRYRKQERLVKQANERVRSCLTGDQRKIILLASRGYAAEEISRELALPVTYVDNFRNGMIQKLINDGLIPSPDWNNVVKWALAIDLIEPPD